MTYHPDPIPLNTLFSSWVFLWAIAYCSFRYFFPSVSLKYWDPTFAILFAISYQLYAFISLLISVTPRSHIPHVLAKLTIVSIVFKLLPLYFVWQHKVNWINSILSCLGLFLVYCVYIRYLDLNLFEIYEDLTESIIDDDNRLIHNIINV